MGLGTIQISLADKLEIVKVPKMLWLFLTIRIIADSFQPAAHPKFIAMHVWMRYVYGVCVCVLCYLHNTNGKSLLIVWVHIYVIPIPKIRFILPVDVFSTIICARHMSERILASPQTQSDIFMSECMICIDYFLNWAPLPTSSLTTANKGKWSTWNSLHSTPLTHSTLQYNSHCFVAIMRKKIRWIFTMNHS